MYECSQQLGYLLLLLPLFPSFFVATSTSGDRDVGRPSVLNVTVSVSPVVGRARNANPLEYTIGGVLSGGRDIDQYFTQVLGVSISSCLPTLGRECSQSVKGNRP